MSKSKVEHITIRNEKLFCLNCGGQHPLIMPISIKEMTNKIYTFNMLHKDCKPTFQESVADQNKSIKNSYHYEDLVNVLGGDNSKENQHIKKYGFILENFNALDVDLDLKKNHFNLGRYKWQNQKQSKH